MSEEWKALTRNRVFISDIGTKREVAISGTHATMGRYAVWSPVSNADSHQVVEVGDNLEVLAEKYKVSRDMVFEVVTQ
ncbi:MAG: hypothetical protein LBK01_01705 [Burkholderiaceae bacterium]|jgi:hypothetical protein|nr:hypothetical protein [Burkholderiaceae bacterium]